VEDLVLAFAAAIESRAWYPAVGAAAAILLAVMRLVVPQVWARIPTRWKPVPALVMVACAAVVDAASAGQSAGVAAAMVAWAVLTAWPVAVGSADAARRMVGGKAASVTTARRDFMRRDIDADADLERTLGAVLDGAAADGLLLTRRRRNDTG
jgi:hypothetical protein